MYTYKSICMYGMWFVLFFMGYYNIHAQKHGILRVEETPYATHFYSGIDLQSLLMKGNEEEATIEFWIRSEFADNHWKLMDMQDGTATAAFTMEMHDVNQLSITYGTEVYDIDLSVSQNGVVENDIWHHVSLTFQKEMIQVYLNGVRRAELTIDLDKDVPRLLFFEKAGNSGIEIAEIRGWTKRRSLDGISDNWLRSFTTLDATSLNELKEQGLYAVFGAYERADSVSVLRPLQTLRWGNVLEENDMQASGASLFHHPDGTIALMEVHDDIEHPILHNQTILLKASKGVFNDKVQLRWNHIEGADSYVITKGVSNVQIGSEQAGSRAVGDPIEVNIQDDILPGEMTTYKVIAQSSEGPGSSGTDYGFIFPNGRISGVVASSSNVGTSDVAIEVGSAAVLPGYAVQFSPEISAFTVKNTEVFRDQGLPRDFMVEFWYSPVAGSGDNAIFKLGNVEIQLQEDQHVHVSNGDGAELLDAPSGVSEGWHHYAIVLAQSGAQLYVDGSLVHQNTVPYVYPNIGVVNTFDINHNAGSTYTLDELRVWEVTKKVSAQTDEVETDEDFSARLAKQIQKYWKYHIGGMEEGLLLYYRFDMNVEKEAYNQAEGTRGQYVAISEQSQVRVSPLPLKYGVYTDNLGQYNLQGINYGSSSVYFTVQPVKVNHTFTPDSTSVVLASSTLSDDYVKTEINFTDESQFNISGNVFYEEDGEVYPVPAGQSFEFASGANPVESDYRPLTGSDGNLVETDNFGQYALSLPIGMQSLRVSNPLQSREFGGQSLYFDGEDDYANTSKIISAPENGVTWSGWMMRSEFSGSAPNLQTIMQIGDIVLALRNNTYLTLYNGSAVLAEVPFAAESGWQFFALSYDQATQTILLFVNETNTATSGIVNPGAFNGQLYLGASVSMENFLSGHLHLIEKRDIAYSSAQLTALKQGAFIEADDDVLALSYSFNENEESLQAVSSTPGSASYALQLVVDGKDEATKPAYDASNVNAYTRKYRYTYEAVGDFAQAHVQKWNVTTPVSDLTFHNQTRYGISGNIIIPCNNSIGFWDVAIERTDVIEPQYVRQYTGEAAEAIFNSEGTVFAVGGLLPGQYKITLTNQNDPDIVLIKFGVDTRLGWATIDFNYRNPLEIKTTVLEELDIDNKWQPYEAMLCASESTERYVLTQQTQYKMLVEFYEAYGENKCYVDNLDYYVAGDLQKVHGQVGTNKVGSASDDPFTSVTGIDTLLVWTAYPNFDAQTDYERILDIQATERDASSQLKALVTGTLQDENQNFSLTFPNVQQVLYDPPGDGSSTTWTSGSDINYATSMSHEHIASAATKITTGTENSAYMGAWVGVGGGSVVLYESSRGEVSTGGNVETALSIQKGNNSSYSVSYDETIATSSGTSLLPGAQSDVFIGTSDIILFAPGKTLAVSGCEVSSEEEASTGAVVKGTEFVYTRYAIENTLIPNLQDIIATLRSELEASGALNAEDEYREDLSTEEQEKVDDIKNYLEDIEQWKEYLDETLATRKQVHEGAINKAFTMSNDAGEKSLPLEKTISAGNQWTGKIGETNATSESFTHSYEIDLTKYINTRLTVFGVKLNLEITLNTSNKITNEQEEGTGESESFQVNLQDASAEDHFDVLIRQDPDYPTPVIVARAGRSSCPVEPNTIAGQGVELSVTNSTGWADLNDEAMFEVTIRDMNKANEAPDDGFLRDYKLAVPSSKLPSGAAVRVEGFGNLVIPRTYTLDAGESKTLKVYVSREDATNSPVDFENIPLSFYSACDESVLSLYEGEEIQTGQDDEGNPIYERQNGVDKAAVLYNDDGSEYVRLRDVKRITARFHAPCAGNLDVKAPEDNWVVNSTSDNVLTFVFKPETLHATFSKVRFQFALENSDEVVHVEDVTLEALGEADDQGYYTYHVNTSSIGADQVYRVRIIPVCGDETEGWQLNNPTEWMTGNIQRSQPVITAFTPLDGAITPNVTASATYNRRMNALTINPLNISLRGILGGVSYEPTSVWFNQAASQIDIPDQALFDLDSSYTIEFWVKPLQVFSSSAITSIVEKGSNWQIGFTNGNHIYAGNSAAVSNKVLDTDGWSHVAIVYGKGTSVNTLSIYINGELDKTVSAGIGNFTINEDPIVIGKANGEAAFKGGLDEMRIWSKALSEATIRTNMKKRLIGTESGLCAYYVFDENALDPEAIADFTANTQGSTSSVVSFVYGDDAAPMDMATMIQNVPLQVNTSADQTQVFVQPIDDYPAELLEGALLTATLHEAKIKDEFGNPAAGKSWTFRIDQNNIEWNKGNHTQVVVAGDSSSFELVLASENASEVSYELIDMPMWLTADNAEPLVNGVYTLPSGHAHPIQFEVATWLSAGNYTGQVKANITQGENLLGVETVEIRVVVRCDDSHLQVTTGGYIMATNIVVQKDGVPYYDGIGKTIIARNASGVVSGRGVIQKSGSQVMANFNVYAQSAAPENAEYNAYLWDDAICQETPIGAFVFNNGASLQDTMDLNYVGKAQYSIDLGHSGYYWLSFRASDVEGDTLLSLSNINGFDVGDRIDSHGMGQGLSAVLSESGWTGAFPLSVTKSYLVYVGGTRTLQVKGYTVASSLPLTLMPSPDTQSDLDNNAVGYLRSDAITVAEAFSRLVPDAAIGDVIISQLGNAQFTPVDGMPAWVGSLTHLIPNQGYKIKVDTASVLRYASASSRVSAYVSVDNPDKDVVTDLKRLDMDVNPNEFAYSAHITGVLEGMDAEMEEHDYMIVAFANEAPRGIAIPQRIDGKWYYFMTLYAHRSGESLQFKWLERNGGHVYDMQDTITFAPSVMIGSMASPYAFRIGKEVNTLQGTFQLFQNVPNPIAQMTTEITYSIPEDGPVEMVITNLMGQRVKVLTSGWQRAGSHKVEWNATDTDGKQVPDGLYIYTLKTPEGILSKRMIVK